MFKKKTYKYWNKKMEDEKLVQTIFSMFQRHFPFSAEDWEEESLESATQKYGGFCHPETDVFDNSEGVQPKQIKKFMKFYSLEDFDGIISILNKGVPQLQRYSSDGFISWERVFIDLIEPLYEEEGNVNKLKGTLLVSYFEPFFKNFHVDEDMIPVIGENQEIIEVIKTAQKLGVMKGNKLSKDSINIESMFEERQNLWQKTNGFKPQSQFMLLSNPNNFDKALLGKLEEVWGTRQIAKMTDQEQFAVSIMVNLLGVNAMVLTKETLLTVSRLSNVNTNEFNVGDFRKVLKNIIHLDPKMSIESVYNYIQIFTKSPHIHKEIEKKDEITHEDLDVYSYMHNMLQYANDNQRKTLLSLDLYFWKTFLRYGVNDANSILNLISLYDKNKENDMNIPIVTGKSKSYEFDILTKDNPLGLILGYATDCCQVIGNAGENCLRKGFTSPDSGFFAVRKKGRIYAQSWIWQKETEKGKILCFDSVEVLGKDLKKSKDILDAYKRVSSILVEKHGYYMVIAGADGNTVPEGIEELGDYERGDFINENDLYSPFGDTYSDAREEIVIIATKE